MVTAGLTPASAARLRWGAIAQGLLWAAIGTGALLLLAKSVQNSSEFGRLQPWILLLNLRRDRAQRADGAQDLAAGERLPGPRARLAPHGAHRQHLRRAGDRAAADRLPVLAGLPQPRHRQLVPGRGQAGPERCAAAVARRDRRAHARILGAHRGACRSAHSASRRATCRRASMPSAAAARRSRSCCSTRTSASSAASLENPLENLPSQPPPDVLRQVSQHRPYVGLEPAGRGRST